MKVFSSSSLPFGQRKESEFLILRLSPARNKFAYLFWWIWNRDSVFFPKTSTTLPCCHIQLLRKFSVQAVYPLNKKMKSISKFWYSRLLKTNSPNFLVEFKTTNYFLPRLHHFSISWYATSVDVFRSIAYILLAQKQQKKF